LRNPELVDTVINYGVSATPVWVDRLPRHVRWINTLDTVHVSAHKLRSFRELYDLSVPILDWTVDYNEAAYWLAEGCTVVTRGRLQGARGQGIVLSPPDRLPTHAGLYTKLFTGDNVREYRVYVVGGHAIDVTEKRRWSRARLTEAGIDRNDPYTKLIRTNGNGWVFARNTMDATEEHLVTIRALAEQCASAIDLGLGAVDIIVQFTDSGKLLDARVVEPNTSVSLVGDRTTRQRIADALTFELDRNRREAA
jgi:hypothetical protein